ncbi:MurR/RpiR family transcriptional regulator [Deinococcus maricopensis]|uniref:Transcriptional regulator, RpiR family n=1 Tax=Deinococcus maricopensis (strain DSM 21211 / LMG 22137 / NRRL B-23946 / LB-34) TaxID=709986 RepID=E8U564_DEIML|nr:MurR/RpiR family transcriptional regulator [Deinococcus maricopensis]ADV66203.1 transcriptional regulator, RpiR family [Deinococcus maricopensis DSM 21211]
MPTTHPATPASAVANIRAQQDFLPATLQRVAAHILEKPERVIYQTITELAQDAGVGESTITRLCRRLGYPGFHAFKIALTTDLAQIDTPTPPSADADVVTRAAHQAVSALEETRRVIDLSTLERVARAIVNAPRIDVVGQGNSGLAAQFFATKLMRLGITTVAYTDPHLATVAAATQTPQGVVLGLTRSGSTIDTVQTLTVAYERGAHTVAVTNRASSPITRVARDVLFTAAPESPLAGGAISSFTSQVLLLEALYLAVYALIPDADDAMRRTAQSVVEKKY